MNNELTPGTREPCGRMINQQPPQRGRAQFTFLRRNALTWLAACVVASFALGLGGCSTPGAGFVQAERATYNAVAPEYSAYVAADGALTADQKTRRLRTVQTWDLSLRQQEGAPATSTGVSR